jgi:NAD(P)-dependent dehydrogenase (short-subunit alcohol dehydrogenase family)
MSGTETALVVGAGKAPSVSLARVCTAEGMRVALVARDIGKLSDLVDETGALAVRCDASQPADVVQLFGQVERELGLHSAGRGHNLTRISLLVSLATERRAQGRRGA